jgi:hypothetical protein
MNCRVHPKYKAVHQPRIECPECWAIWYERNKPNWFYDGESSEDYLALDEHVDEREFRNYIRRSDEYYRYDKYDDVEEVEEVPIEHLWAIDIDDERIKFVPEGTKGAFPITRGRVF